MAVHTSRGTAGAPATAAAVRSLVAGADIEVIPLRSADEKLKAVPWGSAVTVTTSGKLGLDRTLEFAGKALRAGYEVVPHLAARQLASEEELRRFIGELGELGISRLYLIGGDATPPAGPYDSALQVLQALQHIDHGLSRIGVACYPEGHPKISDAALAEALSAKQPFAAYMVSQLCFNPEVLVSRLRRVRGQGITLPLRLGLAAPMQVSRLLTLGPQIGVGTSVRYLAKQHGFIGNVLRGGAYRPESLLQEMGGALTEPGLGIEGLHLFSFNQVEQTARWQQRIAGLTAMIRTGRIDGRAMTGQVIDGRKIADDLEAEVAGEAKDLKAAGITAGIATLLVGGDAASRAYERRIARTAAELGVAWNQLRLAADVSQARVLAEIGRLNADPAVSGILVLRPVPAHINEEDLFTALDPVKDIEAVHPQNAGLLALGRPRYVPFTPAAAFRVLDTWLAAAGEDPAAFYHRSLITVVGRSSNVGKPAVSLAYDRGAAVESVDEWASRSGRLGLHTRRADILIVAAGVPGLIRAEHVREGAVVLDVGINQVTDPVTGAGRLAGDVDFDAVAPRVRAITPVPGGIGPVTDVQVIRNTVTAARNAALPTAA